MMKKVLTGFLLVLFAVSLMMPTASFLVAAEKVPNEP